MPKNSNGWLAGRSTEREAMDNLNLSGKELHRTLDGLSVINRLLGNTNLTFKAVQIEIKKSKNSLKIVDLGCGGGDNLRAIEQWCSQNNHPIQLVGIDGNPHILAYARSHKNHADSIQYLQADLLDTNFQLPDCDLLISSHFIYHFSDKALIQFLKNSQHRVSKKIIFSELRRSRIAYALFKVGGIFMPFSSMVKTDGLRAIRRSFNKKEIEKILQVACPGKFSLRKKWAFRWEIIIATGQ